MNRILVCTDFSPGSTNAMLYAAKLAAATSTTLVLVHVLHETGGKPAGREKETAVNAKLLLTAEELEKRFKVNVNTEKRTGLPVDEIISAARKHRASLIVTGAKETAAGSGLVGGLVYDLMHASLFPVLAVPVGCAFASYREVVFAVDPKNRDKYDDQLLRELTETFHSRLTIAVVTEPGTREKMMKDAAALVLEYNYAGLMHRLHVGESTNLEKGMQAIVKQNEADLLVIIPQRNHYIDRLMQVTKTQKVLRNIDIPLLTLPRLTSAV
ncbi:MAG TPA: universal stress protein [Bacteroidia bacterium]|nr:universal stress protein [Bacteroidia bacterium]